LVECVSEKQIDKVIEEARKHGVIDDQRAEAAKKRRQEELESGKQLKQFHEKQGVVTGKEPIQVDIHSLGLDLMEEGQIKFRALEDNKPKWEKKTVTLKEVVEDVIAKINTLIQENSNEKSVKGKRYLLLNIHDDPFNQYDRLGLPPGKWFINEDEEKKIWLRRLVQALVDTAHILKPDKVNGHGYFIQA